MGLITLGSNNSTFILSFFMYIGVITAAIRGADKAISAGMDWTGVVILGLLVSSGGGTVRDIILQHNVFWLQDVAYIWVAVIVALISALIIQYRKSHKGYKEFKKINLLLDSFCVSSFTLAGLQQSFNMHYGITVSILMGILTCVGGGLIADIIANKVPVVLCTGLNITFSIIAGVIYSILLNVMSIFNDSLIITILVLIFKFLFDDVNFIKNNLVK